MLKLLAVLFAIHVSVSTFGKDLLVLQCGSDWCESGEYVRRVFESRNFRRMLGPRFEFAVYDEMDDPSPKVKEANDKIKDLRIESKRFPAITCVVRSPNRFFAQLENLPFDISAKALASRILAAVKVKEDAMRLFSKAKRLKGAPCADAYGEAFSILASQCGECNERFLREGNLSWKDEWQTFSKMDEYGCLGWKTRFESGTGIGFVETATEFRKKEDFDGGRRYIAKIRSVPTNSLTVVQRQAIEIAEYALWRMNESRNESNKATLRRALALGRDTVWGQCALGYLKLSGGKFVQRERYHAQVLPRPRSVSGAPWAFPMAKVESHLRSMMRKDSFNEKQKLALVQYAILRRIGKDGWRALNARRGANNFIKAFFSDRIWMEDFVWSGNCDDWSKALLALESIVFQDNGRWVKTSDCTGRRFATALALNNPNREEALLADILDACRATAFEKRLHKSALTQSVWLWRFALRQFSGESHPASTQKGYDYGSELAEQQRLLDKTVNIPLKRYSCAAWIVPWRSDNCLGEWVQRSKYYEPWVASGEWILRRYSPIIGGVCGELSKFGSACANTHGLPSMPVGQPGHCAYTQRQKDGSWRICYSVGAGTGFNSILPFHGTGNWTYFQAHEGTFEGDRELRMDADRILEKAFFAETIGGLSGNDISSLYAAACRAWPTHYIAWRSRSDWIVRANRTLGEHREFVDDCLVALKGWRQPLWDLLTPYFDRVAKERGPVSLANEFVRTASSLRQGTDKIQEEGFFDRILVRWTKPIADDPALMERVAYAMLQSQAGTPDRFSQVISWCAPFMFDDESRSMRFASRLSGFFGGDECTDNRSRINLGKTLLSASQSGNVASFRRTAQLLRRFLKPETSGQPYPLRDFGGELLSADGLLKTSSSCGDPGMYAFALDQTPLRGNAFHTDREKSPWAMVVLAGPCRVTGILVVNKTPTSQFRSRQVPIEVQVSEDASTWRTVFTDESCHDEYRVSTAGDRGTVKFVRVRRKPDAREDVFHLNKILVYGRRLY